MAKAWFAACSLAFASSTLAWHLEGHVVCVGNGTGLGGVVVNVQGVGSSFTGSHVSDPDGFYIVYLPEDPGSYSVTLDLSALGGGSVVSPSVPFAFTIAGDEDALPVQDFVVDVSGCTQVGCWLTGGGAKFSTIAGIPVAEKGPRVNFGGNVNPSCSPEPGEGGQWSHVDHEQKLFFQGTAIVVDECGNVSGIPPGSESPVTPYNYIEYHGTGTLKGIAGNKYERSEACFVARAEDRNEPGSSGQRDGSYVDRYYIRVYDCATGAQLLVLQQPPPAPAGQPVQITDGNLQLHISSCAQ